MADDLAHGAFGDVLDRHLRVLDVEQEFRRVADAPEHDEIDIDDILVAGEHQALFGHVADGARGLAVLGRAAHADLDAVDAGHLRQLDRLDRIGPAEVEAGRQQAHELAEAQHDAELLRIDAHREAEKADEGDERHGEQDREGSAHAPAGNGLADAVLAAAQNFLKVGLLAGAAGARAPRPAAAAFPTAAAALIAPRHGEIDPDVC